MYGPVIEGKRLRLRPPKAEDAPVMITWFEDMEVTQYLFVRTPPSLEQEKEWLDARAKDPDYPDDRLEERLRPDGHGHR